MSDLNLFNSADETNANDASLLERRFDGQWIYAVAIREAFSIALRRPVTYSETFAVADKYAPEILGRQELLFRPGESKSARYYREKAALLTARLHRETGSTERRVQPVEAIDLEIKELEDLLKSDNGYNRTQRENLEELHDIRREFEKQEAIPRREQDVLLRDWNRRLDLPTFFPQQAHSHHDFALPGERVMRLRLTHETKAEDIAGVDFIYEYHVPKEKKVRLAAIQYKLPEGDSKNIIIGPEDRDS